MNRKAGLVADLMLVLGVTAVAFSGAGCKKKSGGGTGGGGGAWLVGEDGVMSNIQVDGTLGEGYSLGVDADLLSITCRGADTAFVAGELGTLLRTFDAGETWDSIDLGTTSTLRDVAAARASRVYVAGDDAIYVSRDDGDSWLAVPSSERAWLSITTAGDGARALALDAEGDIWSYDDVLGGFQPATRMPGLRAIALSHDGAYAAAVGAGGALVYSSDGGATWSTVATGTTAALQALWVTESGSVIAVGEGGTLVRMIGDDVEVTTPATGTLRAVHIDDLGHGLIAGDVGSLMTSHDGGDTWEPLDLALGGTIYALDEVEGNGHL